MAVRPRVRRSTTALVGALTLALAAPAAAYGQGSHADFTPGAPGVGDPYYPDYGNGGYDVGNYDLSLRYDPESDHLDGVARIRARATQDLSRFDLDLVGLTVHSVRVNGRASDWSRTDHELTVTPPQGLRDGSHFTVDVAYDGVPVTFTIAGTTLEAGFMHTDDGAVVAGQPEVATAWFPVNDHPQDRARYTYRVTVPDAYDVVANGLPRGTRSHGGWTTHVWKVHDPQISYLATFDVGQWDVRRSRTDDGIPVIDAVDPDLGPNVDASLARQPEILDALQGWFGDYPFETVGAIVDDYPNLHFALENQGRPVYAPGFFRRGPNPGVVVHELAHQWFGDSVAVHHWADIWLNEGFASYAEWLWAEHEGQGTPQEIFQATYDDIPAGDSFWDVTIGDPGVDDLFSDPVYVRGAMTLQALRNAVGDVAFFEIVRTWARTHASSTGSTSQFIALAEQVSGQDLGDLFDTWLFTGEKPPAATASARAAGATDTQARTWARDWHDTLRHRLATAGRY